MKLLFSIITSVLFILPILSNDLDELIDAISQNNLENITLILYRYSNAKNNSALLVQEKAKLGTPLEWAIWLNNTQALLTILDSSTTNKKTLSFEKLFIYAISCFKIECLKVLLDATSQSAKSDIYGLIINDEPNPAILDDDLLSEKAQMHIMRTAVSTENSQIIQLLLGYGFSNTTKILTPLNSRSKIEILDILITDFKEKNSGNDQAIEEYKYSIAYSLYQLGNISRQQRNDFREKHQVSPCTLCTIL